MYPGHPKPVDPLIYGNLHGAEEIPYQKDWVKTYLEINKTALAAIEMIDSRLRDIDESKTWRQRPCSIRRDNGTRRTGEGGMIGTQFVRWCCKVLAHHRAYASGVKVLVVVEAEVEVVEASRVAS